MASNVGELPKLPALRMTPEGGCVIGEEVPLDLTSNNTFSVSYASTSRASPLSPSDWPGIAEEQAIQEASPPSTRSRLPPVGSQDSFFQVPQYSRSASMPLPSQLSQLQHPHKLARADSHSSTGPSPSSDDLESTRVKELSFELADSIQMIIQTLLQVSPPQVLDITKEQFSACSLSVPTSSMSAMFTVMKNINYLSAHMPSYFKKPPIPGSGKRAEKQLEEQEPVDPSMEFDIGEVLQCIGDSLSGTAAEVGVDLVIYHGDVSLKHVNVVGDEAGLSYAISHVIRQILAVAERGDTVELGLLFASSRVPSPGESSSSSLEMPLHCTLRISHRFAFPERLPNDPYGPEPEQVRRQPNFSSLLLRRILRHTSGSIQGGLPPPENFSSGRTVELNFPLRRPRSTHGTPDETETPEDVQFQHDPTLRELVAFAETLKGKKVTLYASPKACFAQHLTSYLTAWSMDVSHISPDGNVDGTVSSTNAASVDSTPTTEDAKSGDNDPVSFVFIDDDIDALRERLLSQRFGHNGLSPSQVLSKKRPPLASLHRPRSTLNVPHQSVTPKSSAVIMHFTSLSNYKHLKDVVQSIMASYSAAMIPLPEVMILPKPAGPRRFLTALHTAVTKPSVDPPFIPIATSPLSPGLATGSFFGTYPVEVEQATPSKAPSSTSQPVSPTKPLRPSGTRTNSDRSVKSNRDVETKNALPNTMPITPSPLSIPDQAEYFASAASKFGATPSSGMVVQSPDGQPAGILFRPKARTPKTPSTGQEREKGQLVMPPRRLTSRAPQNGTADGGASFSSLYSAAATSLAASPISRVPNGEASGLPSTSSPRSAYPSDRDRLAATALAMQPPPSLAAAPANQDKAPTPAQSPKIPDGKAASPSTSPRAESPAMLRRRHLRKMSQGDKEVGTSTPIKKPKPSDNNVTPPISVLIVDDNPINQTILSTFMKKKKIKYDIANNGEEAVHKWQSGNFHLILMDIQMPIMDGIQATKEIRRLEKVNSMAGYPPMSPGETQRTPSDPGYITEFRAAPSPYRSSVIIVALTASSLQSDRDAALAAGCNDFLTKPVSLLWLNNKIIEWGSIKALQVWADIRPAAEVKKMNAGQIAKAKAVADRLHVPRKKTPSPTPRRSSSLNKEEGAAALALASPANTMSQALKDTLTALTAEQSSISRPRQISDPPRLPNTEDKVPESMNSSGELPKRTPLSNTETTDDESANECGSRPSVDGDGGQDPKEDKESDSTPRQRGTIADATATKGGQDPKEDKESDSTPRQRDTIADATATKDSTSHATSPTPTPTVPTLPNQIAEPDR